VNPPAFQKSLSKLVTGFLSSRANLSESQDLPEPLFPKIITQAKELIRSLSFTQHHLRKLIFLTKLKSLKLRAQAST
jgi:hypothetical protein